MGGSARGSRAGVPVYDGLRPCASAARGQEPFRYREPPPAESRVGVHGQPPVGRALTGNQDGIPSPSRSPLFTQKLELLREPENAPPPLRESACQSSAKA